MALHVDLDKWNPPTVDEKVWNEMLKTMTISEACRAVYEIHNKQKEKP